MCFYSSDGSSKGDARICVTSLFLLMLSFTDNFFTKAELGAGGWGGELLMDMAFL